MQWSHHVQGEEDKSEGKKDKGKDKTNNIHNFLSRLRKSQIKETRGETLGCHLGLSHSQHALHCLKGKCRSLEHYGTQTSPSIARNQIIHALTHNSIFQNKT